MNKENTISNTNLILLGVCLLLLGFCRGYFKGKSGAERVIVDTLVVEHWDTTFIDRPTEVVRYVVRRDTIVVNAETKPQIVVVNDSTVVVPISQAVYRDSTEQARYKAYVSGYRAALDSISIECLSTTTTITKIEREQARRWGLGVNVGVGIGTKGAAPYAGVGVFYRLW